MNVEGLSVKIIVLGCGNIGSVAAQDVAESLPSAEIVVSDVNKSRAEEAASKTGLENVSWVQTDASNQSELLSAIKKCDLAIGALPGWMGYQACKASITAKVDMVDVSYMPEDVMKLDKAALKAKVSIVPDCGMSPGLGNILIGHAVSRLDQLESVHIWNGGLPEKPVPPLDYVVTWSVKDLIDMYSRKVNIVKDGKVVQVEAMSGLEATTFPRVGKLEAFYTDGLRTLLHTMKGAKDMCEKTLRYPWHIEKIKLLKTLGFFDEKPIEVENLHVSPRDITTKLLEKKLRRPEIRDIVAMRVEVGGLKKGKQVIYTYQMFDRYDKRRKVTAMARTTAYTASVVAQLLAKRTVEEKGVIPPEKLGMNEKIYKKFMSMMKERRVVVKESKKTLH
jgi:saccharopine dehydrogenase-like NADP-dependent oxidoreductase